MKPQVAVIGAGWSGLAAAITLLDAGLGVTLVDAAPQTGGRARRVSLALGDREYAVDNGQHLLIGAYSEYVALARRVGVAMERRFRIEPFALRYPDGFRIAAVRAPAPLHLAVALGFARGLTVKEKAAAALWVRRWERQRWTIDSDRPAAALLHDHPARLIDRLWGPLCLAALNVRLEEASGRMFLRVLGDSLGATAAASDLLLPRTNLSALLPDAAEATFVSAGGNLRLRASAQAITRPTGSSNWEIRLRTDSLRADAVVLALPPARSVDLLHSAALPELSESIGLLNAIDSAPIATVYLRFPDATRLAKPIYALAENPSAGDFGQWVFDRGLLEPACAGVLSVVVSGSGPQTALSMEELAGSVARQLSRCFNLPASLAHAVVVEKRATIVPFPGLRRPDTRLAAKGLYLAGDSADSPYPSTLEGSVRSGLAAARAVINDIAQRRLIASSA